MIEPVNEDDPWFWYIGWYILLSAITGTLTGFLIASKLFVGNIHLQFLAALLAGFIEAMIFLLVIAVIAKKKISRWDWAIVVSLLFGLFGIAGVLVHTLIVR